jgi:succinate dehydrogenase / fumarate reductase cytochrome b subunit
MCFPLRSITKKQIVAATGLLLIVYLISHLAGNLFIYAGPAFYNAYAAKLETFGPLLRIAEIGLLFVFVLHIWMTALVVLENIKARGGLKQRYAVDQPVGRRSLATRLMPWTGTYIFLFVIWHLFDFMYADHSGARSYIAGKSYGLYGVVVNSFMDPVHSFLYIMAMCFLGLHLAHGVESFLQTWGLKNPKFAPVINQSSHLFALLMVIGYSSIPVYVLYFL